MTRRAGIRGSGSRPASFTAEEFQAEVKRLEKLHDDRAAEAYDRNDVGTWQYHVGASSSYSYILWMLSGLH